VLDRAIAMANSNGLHALTIRALAKQTHMPPMSVYKFVSSKDDLLDEMAIRVMDRIELPQPPSDSWIEWIISVMGVWRDLAIANPCMVQILASRRVPAHSIGFARLMQSILANLRRAGFEDEEAARGFWQIFTFTFGHVVFEIPRVQVGEETEAKASESLAAVARARGFSLVELLATPLTSARIRADFSDSLRSLLIGMESSRSQRESTIDAGVSGVPR